MRGGVEVVGGGGKEGDWECNGCHNKNYAFRSLCNRCKQPRFLVDTKTPADSKWLPRIGDWICSGCTNNNYASRENCKKCGQPKELAAMPAVAIPGASVPTYPTYFARVQGGIRQVPNVGSTHPSVPTDPYGLQPASNWPLRDIGISVISYDANMNQFHPVSNSNELRSGYWMCTCGFYNYSSRAQCKKCNSPSSISASLANPAAPGTKRQASEEFLCNWDNKRLNAGQQPPCSGFESSQNHGGFPLNSMYLATPCGNAVVPPNWQVNHQVPAIPTLFGKGAKQWRDGDWMCSNCNNHNYASRAECNRCKSQREVSPELVSVD